LGNCQNDEASAKFITITSSSLYYLRIVAYLYTNLLLERSPDPTEWGVGISRVYHDLSVAPNSQLAASKGSSPNQPRSQWQRLVQDCTIEPVDYVVVRQLGDLGDSLQAVRDRLAELEPLHIQVVELASFADLETLKPSQLEPVVASSRLQQFNQLQTQQRRDRIRQGHARNRVNALPPPGKAPYGYRRGKTGYVLDRATAPVVQDFFEQFLLYGSVRGAVRYLAKRYNKKIAASTGQRWLTNPVYRGDLQYHDGHIVRDAHPAMISRDEAAQVDRLLRRNRRLPARSASAPRSLAGLVKCGECQSAMTIAHVTTHNRQQEYLYLRPRTCPLQPKCAGLAYDEVLQATIQQICEDLPRVVSEVELSDMTQIKQAIMGAITQKRSLLERIPALMESQVFDQDTAALRTYNLQTEIAELQNQLAQLPPVDLQATAKTLSIAQFWYDLSETERRAYFREFIREIQLLRQAKNWQLKLIFAFFR